MIGPITNTIEIELQGNLRFQARNAAGASVVADATPPDGSGLDFSPMELLLAGLGCCTAMDVASILRKKRQDVQRYQTEVVGVRAVDHPRVYTEIRVRHIVSGHNVSEDALRHAVELSEQKYCSAWAMLSKAAPISSDCEVRETSPALA